MTLIRSRSSDNHTHKHAYRVFVCVCVWGVCVYVCCLHTKHAYLCVCVHRYIFVSFAFLNLPDSCLPNSVFLLDTGGFICPITSCRPCPPAFLPGFHRFSECVFLMSLCMCVCIHIFCLFAFLSIPDSCLPISLFLLDTGYFMRHTTSCRSCHPTFLPILHRLCEFECFSWVFTE